MAGIAREWPASSSASSRLEAYRLDILGSIGGHRRLLGPLLRADAPGRVGGRPRGRPACPPLAQPPALAAGRRDRHRRPARHRVDLVDRPLVALLQSHGVEAAQAQGGGVERVGEQHPPPDDLLGEQAPPARAVLLLPLTGTYTGTLSTSAHRGSRDGQRPRSGALRKAPSTSTPSRSPGPATSRCPLQPEPSVSEPARQRAHQRRSGLPGEHCQALQPDPVRTAGLAHAAARVVEPAPRELPVSHCRRCRSTGPSPAARTFAMYNYYEPFLLDGYASTIKAAYGRPPCVELRASAGARRQAVLTIARAVRFAVADFWPGRSVAPPQTTTPSRTCRSGAIPWFYVWTLALILAAVIPDGAVGGRPLRASGPNADLAFMGAAILLLETRHPCSSPSSSYDVARQLARVRRRPRVGLFRHRGGPSWSACPSPLPLTWRCWPRWHSPGRCRRTPSLAVGDSAFLCRHAIAFSPVFLANLIFAQRFKDVGSSDRCLRLPTFSRHRRRSTRVPGPPHGATGSFSSLWPRPLRARPARRGGGH